MTSPKVPADEWAWQRQSVWSQTANALKARPQRLWAFRLALTVAAAALALAGSQVKVVNRPTSVALAVAAAAAMAAVGLMRSRQDVEQVRRWTRARSVSEAIKTEVFRFLTRSGPYAMASDPEAELEAEVQRFERDAGDLLRYTQGFKSVSRSLPAVHDLESYLDVRVRRSQLRGYYEPKALQLRKRLQIAKIAEVALALVAAMLAALATVSANVSAWTAVATTGVGAISAYIASQRYEFLWIEYSRTANELRRLLDRRTSADGTPLTGSDLVGECEQVISIQNQAWMAKLGDECDTSIN